MAQSKNIKRRRRSKKQKYQRSRKSKPARKHKSKLARKHKSKPARGKFNSEKHLRGLPSRVTKKFIKVSKRLSGRVDKIRRKSNSFFKKYKNQLLLAGLGTGIAVASSALTKKYIDNKNEKELMDMNSINSMNSRDSGYLGYSDSDSNSDSDLLGLNLLG
jgi:hypothetical protein